MEGHHLTPLISDGKDSRQFRRFATHQNAGVRPIGWAVSRYAAVASADQGEGVCYHSAAIRDLSMTGLYLVSKLPYQVGLQLEAQISLPPGLITVTGVVHRMEKLPYFHGRESAGVYGCGVNFLQSLMGTTVRRTLMHFLLQLAPHELRALPHQRAPSASA